MKKSNIWTLVFSLIFLFFVNTCYKEIPHIVTIHFAVDNDFYQQDGLKTYSGMYQIKVYPRQTFYEVVDGKEPSQWNWTGNTHSWKKTEYGDYGFSTINGDNTMTVPFVYSFPWTDASLFTVDHIQNTQTIGLFDELYDIKDIFVPYRGPSAPINVTFVFNQNSFNSTNGVEDSDTVSEKKEVRITKSYLSGAPISDTPAEILNKNEDGEIIKYWAASNPVSRYSQNKYGVSDLKDYGYLEYFEKDPDNEDKGIYFSFLDNAYSQVKDSYSPEGRYSYVVTDDAENENYIGATYISNDASYLLPRHNLIVRPVYKEPVEDVTYIYYDRFKTLSNEDYKKTTISYRVGRRLKSPQDLKDDYVSKKTTSLYWDSIGTVQNSPFENYGYEDRSITKTETQKYQLYNFRAKSEDEKAYYIFAETDYDGNVLPDTPDIYSDSRILRSMNIKPRYSESGKISLIFNFSTNPDADSKKDNTISVEEYANADYVFYYQIGSKELKDWNKSVPYADDYPIGYGYRDYDLESGLTKGTLYLFNPATEGENDYQFKYKKLVNPSSYGSNRYEETVIGFGEHIDLRYYESSGEDSIIFTPLYIPDQIAIRFKHYTSQKPASSFIECKEDISQIRINRGEEFPFVEEDIEQWIFDEASKEYPGIVGWKKDVDVNSYGYVTNESNVEKWFDYNRSKASVDDEYRKYRFIVLEGPDKDSIITLDGYHFHDLLLLPIYTPDMVTVTLKYYVTEGSTINTDSTPRVKEVVRAAEVQKGANVKINPTKFGDKDYLWYDPKLGNWPTDNDDYAHSLAKDSTGENYNLDFRNELKYGYRDVNDNFKRYYFGSEAWYCPNQRSSFTFIDVDTGNEVVMHTRDEDVQYDTDYKITKDTTFVPKYINAGYAAKPVYFTAPTTSVRSSATEDSRDDFLSKYSHGFVYIPGLTIGDKWPHSSMANVVSNPALSSSGYSPKAEVPYNKENYPYNVVATSKPNGDFAYSTNSAVNNLYYGETYISRQFFLYSLISYYKNALGDPSESHSEIKIDMSTIENVSASLRLNSVRAYNDYLIEFDRGDISADDLMLVFPDIKQSVLKKESLFTFHRNTLMASDDPIYTYAFQTSSINEALSFYHMKDLCMNNLSAIDMITFCNLMTYNYNVQNPDNQLSYVYTRPNDGAPFGGLTADSAGNGIELPGLFRTYKFFVNNSTSLTNMGVAYKNQPLVLKETDTSLYNLEVDNAKSGFRLPSYYESEYVDSVILNELILGVKEDVLDVNGNSTGDSYYNYSIFNKKLSATEDHPNGQYYYKRPIGYVLDGLMNMNGTTVSQRYKNRGSNKSNKSDVHSYISAPTASNHTVKRNLNHRSGANIFDPQGFLNEFIVYGGPFVKLNSGATSYHRILAKMNASDGFFIFYDPTGTRTNVFGFRVCRNAN